MRKNKYSEEQIIRFPEPSYTVGMPLKDLCRQEGCSEATFYKWRAKFGGLQASEASRPREFEAENGKRQDAAGGSALGLARAQERLGRKALAPRVRRWAVERLMREHQMSERRACHLVGLSRDAYRNAPMTSVEDQAFSETIRTIAHKRRRFGYRRLHDLLWRTHPGINHKRVYRLYR